ncbi:MAG: hypothetical protein ACFBRM_13765 [Pikeienuella sp.]
MEPLIPNPAERDIYFGLAGNDEIFDGLNPFLGTGSDLVFGGSGDDDYIYFNGRDLFVGGRGGDTLSVARDPDTATVREFLFLTVVTFDQSDDVVFGIGVEETEFFIS